MLNGSVDDENTPLSLNQVQEPTKRSRSVRVMGTLSFLVVFTAFLLPLISSMINNYLQAGPIALLIAMAQTTCLVFMFAHAFGVYVISSAPVSYGLTVYFCTMMIILAMFQIVSFVSLLRAPKGLDNVDIAEVVLLGVSIVGMIICFVLAIVKRSRVPRKFRKSTLKVNLLSLIVGLLVGVLATTALVLDYYKKVDEFHFPPLIFPNMFYKQTTTTVTSILSSLVYLGALCAVPYTHTITRISIDNQLDKSETVMGVLILGVIVVSQTIVFISSLVYISNKPGYQLEASVVLLLFVTGLFALRGVMYSLYVLCIVDKQVKGEYGESIL